MIFDERAVPRWLRRLNVKNFESRIKFGERDACWPWIGARLPKGYGTYCFSAGSSPALAHRISFSLYVGPIPEAFEIDHLCNNTWCVNPSHLNATSPYDNNMRSKSVSAVNSKKTHCKHGHVFDSENTYIRKERSGRRGRTCRRCQANHQKSRRDKTCR